MGTARSRGTGRPATIYVLEYQSLLFKLMQLSLRREHVSVILIISTNPKRLSSTVLILRILFPPLSWDYRDKEQTRDCVLDCVYGHWQGERGGQRFILKKWIQRLLKGRSSTSLSATSVGPLSLWARSKRCQFFWQYSTAFWACKILKQKQIDDCFYCYVFNTNLKINK
jgi:hypothetical protein